MTKEEVIKTLDEYSSEFHLTLRHEDGNSPDWMERMARMELAIDTAATMLQNATIWTPCTERMPDLEDANEDGYVNTQRRDGTTEIEHWDDVRKSEHIIAWSRIEPKGGGNG